MTRETFRVTVEVLCQPESNRAVAQATEYLLRSVYGTPASVTHFRDVSVHSDDDGPLAVDFEAKIRYTKAELETLMSNFADNRRIMSVERLDS